jgi:integrase
MFLSKHATGYYYVWYRDDNKKKHKVSTRTRLKVEAIKFFQSFRREEHERLQKAKQILLSSFFKDYLQYVQSNLARRTWIIHRNTCNRFVAMFGDIPLMSVTARHFDLYKSHRLNMLKRPNSKNPQLIRPITVNIDLRTLQTIFNTAVRWDLILKNPFVGSRPAFTPQQSPVFCTKEDVQKLMATVSERWLKDIIVLAVLTGMRRGEIVNLRWKDVNMDNRTLKIESNPSFKSKQGRRRVIPLNDTAYYLLQSRFGKSTSEYVFTLNGKKIFDEWITHAFKKAVIAAKLEDSRIHFHSLRHTFASWLVQDGVSLYEVQKLLGHSSTRVTEVYSHLQPEMRHDTVNRIHVNMN